MREELLEYYERELTYLRQMGGEFARKYPNIAGRLLLDPERCEDPHISRLLEGFALLAARVHKRIDDDFPEVFEALTRVIHPGYLRPIPSMTIVECQRDPAQGKKTELMRVPRGAQLVSKGTVDGMPCRFQTAYDVDLWPFHVAAAEWNQPERMKKPPRSTQGVQTGAAVRVKLQCQLDATFAGQPISTLRFHLAGDANVVYTVYELLFEKCVEIQLRDPKDESRVVILSRDQIKPVGFAQDESLLPFVRRSIDGHRLLQEYFAFPDKFLFFDVTGLEVLAGGGFTDEAELIFIIGCFERFEREQILELGVNERTFRLGCTPAVNLFTQGAEPILLNQMRHEYTVIPDSRHSEIMEVFSIEDVIATNPRLRQSMTVEPFHAYRHQTRNQPDMAFWVASRSMNELGQRQPSTMSISIVDLKGNFVDPEADVLMVKTLCTNFDQPSRIRFGNEQGDFEIPGYPAAKNVVAFRRPTQSCDPPAGKGHVWRLVSLLSLNYLSLCEEGCGALQEILRLHNMTDSVATDNQVGSILNLKTEPGFALVNSAYGLVPARGTQVEIDFDEQQFAGSGLYLFAAVLERFLAGYASMNSFAQLTARSTLRKEALAKWPPRAGTQTLL